MRIAGVWQDDRRFGLQVKVALRRAAARRPATTALIAYLRRVKHVGPARAARLLDRYGDDVLDAIDDDPRARVPRAGAQPEARQRGDPLVGRRCAPRARCTCCWRRTGSPGWSRGSHKDYGDRAHRVVRERPYELTSVFGVGFASRTRSPARPASPRDCAGARARRPCCTCWPRPSATARPACRSPSWRAAAAELLGGAPPTAELLGEMADARRARARVRRRGGVGLPRRRPRRWRPSWPSASTRSLGGEPRAPAERPGADAPARRTSCPRRSSGPAVRARVRARGCRSSPAARAPARPRRSG